MPRKKTVEIVVPMTIDVDGAPNAYGPKGKPTLDNLANAYNQRTREIVGFLTVKDDGKTPVVQGQSDPCPGYYVSTTTYEDRLNPRKTDPRRYVNAAEINYALWARVAREARVGLGDFCVVHSLRTRFTVYAIVGDSGHSSGAEGSLALLQRLGYDNAKDGRSGGEDDPKIVVRYFSGTNPDKLFFFLQTELEARARMLDLDVDFSSYHAHDPGKLVLDAIAHSGGKLRVLRHAPFVPLRKKQKAPVYPAHLIKLDSTDTASVRLIQQRLCDLGFTQPGRKVSEPLRVDGIFGTHTVDAVKLFQIRHTDLYGRPLQVDGEIGSDTWSALFGRTTVYASKAKPSGRLMVKVLDVASGEIGVREDPPGSNKGKRVGEYQRAVGIDSGEPWCVAFVFFCFATASRTLKIRNPMDVADCKTGSVLDLWNRAGRAKGVQVLLHDDALDDPSKVRPGMVFAISTGGGNGHVGFVTKVNGNYLETIEGNTNDGGSREGIGVFRRTGRTIDSINRGFVGFATR
jgi:CHAP domain-containing protein/putative peptidoglycan binding protein